MENLNFTKNRRLEYTVRHIKYGRQYQIVSSGPQRFQAIAENRLLKSQNTSQSKGLARVY